MSDLTSPQIAFDEYQAALKQIKDREQLTAFNLASLVFASLIIAQQLERIATALEREEQGK